MQGSPDDWKIDSNGNFMCLNVKGCFIEDEMGVISYSYLGTIAPLGGADNNRDKNIAVLEKGNNK